MTRHSHGTALLHTDQSCRRGRLEGSASASQRKAGAPAGHRSWPNPVAVDRALEAVEERLKLAVAADSSFVQRVSSHLLSAGGKRLRPTLVLLAADVGNLAAPGVLEAAVAVELLHAATLYHDDVIDGALHRRGGPSANRLFGSRTAVFGGTLLFSRALELFSSLGKQANGWASETVSDLWQGQTIEAEQAFDMSVELPRYFEVIEGKTASLCRLPCQLGALTGGVSEARAGNLATYGRKLGLAFQLADDLLDLTGTWSSNGKAPGIDLAEGIYTLPVLLCLELEEASSDQLRQLLDAGPLAPSRVAMAVEILRTSGVFDTTLERIRELVLEATEALAPIPDSSAKTSLIALANGVSHRARGTVPQ